MDHDACSYLPSASPAKPTSTPTASSMAKSTSSPSTMTPSKNPATSKPSKSPAESPSYNPTNLPSTSTVEPPNNEGPSYNPTYLPSANTVENPTEAPFLFPSEAPSYLTTTSIFMYGNLQLSNNCTNLGEDVANIVETAISNTIEPSMGDNQLLQGVVVTSICENGAKGQAPIKFIMLVTEVCGNRCDTVPELATSLADNAKSTLVSSLNNGSFEQTLHKTCYVYNNTMLASAGVSPVTADDFTYTLVTRKPTSAPTSVA